MGERISRGLLSVQPRLVFAAVGIFVAAIVSLVRVFPGEVAKMPNATTGIGASCVGPSWGFPSWAIVVLWIAFAVVALFLVLSAYFEYRRRTYDCTLISRYDETFDKMITQRITAARFLLDRSINSGKECGALEDILDIFEDLGFYLKGNQLSSEVAHHTFEYCIRTYCQAAESYIAEMRRKEPTIWEHLDYLLSAVSRIEIRKLKSKVKPEQLRLTDEELTRRLKLEIPDNKQDACS